MKCYFTLQLTVMIIKRSNHINAGRTNEEYQMKQVNKEFCHIVLTTFSSWMKFISSGLMSALFLRRFSKTLDLFSNTGWSSSITTCKIYINIYSLSLLTNWDIAKKIFFVLRSCTHLWNKETTDNLSHQSEMWWNCIHYLQQCHTNFLIVASLTSRYISCGLLNERWHDYHDITWS